MRLPEIARLPVLADIVAKGFLGWRSIFFRTTDAFRSTRYEGPHRFTKTTRELRIGVTEYCSGHVGQKSTFARFLTSFDFRLLQQYRHIRDISTVLADDRYWRYSGPRLSIGEVCVRPPVCLS